MNVVNTTDYSHEFFHNLKDSNDMWGLADLHQDALHTLGSVICRHYMEDSVGVSLVHRHHDLHEEERFVWELSDNVWCAEPKILAESNLMPINWGVGISEGKPCLYPLEFCIVNSKHNPEFLVSNNVLLNSDFIKDFTETAISLNMQNLSAHFNKK